MGKGSRAARLLRLCKPSSGSRLVVYRSITIHSTRHNFSSYFSRAAAVTYEVLRLELVLARLKIYETVSHEICAKVPKRVFLL